MADDSGCRALSLVTADRSLTMRYLACFLLWGVFCSSLVFGQGNNGNNNNQSAGGIEIDARGVVKLMVQKRETPAQIKQRNAGYLSQKLPSHIVVTTPRRVVSLKELELQVRAALLAGREIPMELQALCGIHRLDEVYIDIENRDLLIAGPAEGFAPDSQGRLRGIDSGRPPLLLDDLVVALRAAYSPDGSIGCSIDPTQQNMARLQEYLRQNSTVTSDAGAAQRYRSMAAILGPQEVSVWGTPRDTHLSMVLVEADLRMKRISLGVEQSGVRGVRSQLSLLKPQGNSLQRWWFVPKYDPVQTDEQRAVFRLSGPRVKLLAQDEFTDNSGRRFDATQTRDSTVEFARLFSEHYAEIAVIQPVFAELQNVFDLAILGALIRQEGLAAKTEWPMTTFLESDQLPLGHYADPRYVPSLATNRKVGNLMLGLVGGVVLEPQPQLRIEVNRELTIPITLSREQQKLTWDVVRP